MSRLLQVGAYLEAFRISIWIAATLINLFIALIVEFIILYTSFGAGDGLKSASEDSCYTNKMKPFSFEIKHRLDEQLARTGVIHTPRGDIQTPAFIVVGTKANVKAMVPEMVENVGAQAVWRTHTIYIYSQDRAHRRSWRRRFMNWNKPTFTDSGGFQVLSLGSGFKKVLAMTTDVEAEIAIAKKVSAMRGWTRTA